MEAIRLLLKDLAGAPISADIDWDYWRGARHRLEENHATLARDEALEKVVHRATSRAGFRAHGEPLEAYRKDKGSIPGIPPNNGAEQCG